MKYSEMKVDWKMVADEWGLSLASSADANSLASGAFIFSKHLSTFS
jgi:hypothetical protein